MTYVCFRTHACPINLIRTTLDCEKSAAAINLVEDEYTGPPGNHGGVFCSGADNALYMFSKSESACLATAEAINNLIFETKEGSFNSQCLKTTATSTQTTSGSSSQTTSVTTSKTSTFTSTPTTSDSRFPGGRVGCEVLSGLPLFVPSMNVDDCERQATQVSSLCCRSYISFALIFLSTCSLSQFLASFAQR